MKDEVLEMYERITSQALLTMRRRFMRASAMCISCILSRQEKMIRSFSDEEKKSEYIHQVLEILCRYGKIQSAPFMVEKINHLYESVWGAGEDYTQVKKLYNHLLLEKEAQLWKKIQGAKDPMKESIKYACAANYIDFSAVANVNEETFEKLMLAAEKEELPEEEYLHFKKDLQKARKLVYLTDNCGEIVLDKLFIRCIKENYPELQITVIVRGEDVINDATMEDAKAVGLTDVAFCVENGNGAPSTVPARLSKEAKENLNEADVIISKGQGNFEGLYGEGFNPYYLFLCKCELFVRRFSLEQFQSVFMKEERIHLKMC